MDYLAGTYFFDGRTGLVSGTKGTVLKTTDGGETWVKKNSGTEDQLTGLHFADDRNGWAVGNPHAIVDTDNGGETWSVQDPGSWTGLWTVYVLDADDCWAVGGRNIMRTSTAGLPGAVWAKKQEDGKPANFGHLVVVRKTDGYLWAEHPDSRIGIHIKTSDPKPQVGDYVYVHGKIASGNDQKYIAADSIEIMCAGWGVLPEKGVGL
jgi:photosystem II stability/assembly factor-like uncharacterized protein